MEQENKYSRPLEGEDTQIPLQSSSGDLLAINLQDLENDLRSECAGIWPQDVEEELRKTTNFNLDLMAASLWADEERETRGKMQRFAHPSTDKEMNWNLSDDSQGSNLFDQDTEELQLDNHQRLTLQDPTYFNSIKSHHLQESQDSRLNYGHQLNPESAPCSRQYDGGESTHQSLPWSSYDASTQNHMPNPSTYDGASLYEEAGLALDSSVTPKGSARNAGFPFTEAKNYEKTNALPCLGMKSSNSSNARYFRVKTPKGYLELKTVPFVYDSSTVQDGMPVIPSSCQGLSFPGKREVHLLAESVRLEGSSLTPSPGHTHLGQNQHPCFSQEEAQKKRLPGQHRKPRKFMAPGDEKQQHKRTLASIRSKQQIQEEKANIQLLVTTEQRAREKNQVLSQLCQNFESMRMTCRELYHQYGTLLPPSSREALDQYANQTDDRRLFPEK